ncbi:hypothetical protein LA080_014925 [Diaporthe eres]|nr:hypothetical protein LA080_014925 [Diaporthe eres]
MFMNHSTPSQTHTKWSLSLYKGGDKSLVTSGTVFFSAGPFSATATWKDDGGFAYDQLSTAIRSLSGDRFTV